jgi:DNA (cytosine-5)-methyltransferase 1
MKIGSLFSGIGGFDLGLERAGMDCAWQVEIEKNCLKLLADKFPNAKRYEDVRTVGRSNLEPVDLICGGFPCQDLSIAGKREGLAGERSGLWFEFARIIEELNPRWVVIENVPGLLSSNKGRDFAIILSGLVERGYGVCWRVLDSQYFGVAQRRRRVFIVGSLGNGRAAEVLFEREGVRWDPPARRQAGEDVANSVAPRVGGRYHEGEGLTFDWQSGGDVRLNLSDKPMLQAHQVPAVMAHGQANAEILEDKSPTLNLNHEQPIVWQMNHASEVYREGNQETMATLQARMGTGGNNVPLVGVRRLTPMECERLQGFPDGWTDAFSDSTRYRMLGNAVTVNVAEWIGKRLMELVA